MPIPKMFLVFVFQHPEVDPNFFCAQFFFVSNLLCKIPQFQVFRGKVNFEAQILENICKKCQKI